jgi:hypothetical protein
MSDKELTMFSEMLKEIIRLFGFTIIGSYSGFPFNVLIKKSYFSKP